MTITPSPTDVKPTGNYRHPGNKLYTDLVKEKRKAFVLAHMQKDKQTQNAMILSIYESIGKQTPPGRFLEKDRNGAFSVKSKKDALKKIRKALNENRAKIEEYFRLREQHPRPANGTKTTGSITIASSKTPSLQDQDDTKISKYPKLTVIAITPSDWENVIEALSSDEEKSTKRQRLRGFCHKGKTCTNARNKDKEINRKKSRKDGRNNEDDLCQRMKAHSLSDKRRERKKNKLGLLGHFRDLCSNK